MKYNLTEYSHGAGCGCKLSPGVLSEILSGSPSPEFASLLVGTETKDDAAVFDLDGKTAIISTTDFFMPIVDDAADFGRIAATNAISDIYAMGGEPLMAIAILGWPIDKLPATEAASVLQGGREVCHSAGIPLAGGHSIDAPEPIFGLAVTGKAPVARIKKNSGGTAGDLLYLTKPLGVGLVTTAQKRKLADPDDLKRARNSMLMLNKVGMDLGAFPFVHALTDVTGFGLAGHLIEVCEASSLGATLWFDKLPFFDFVAKYLALDCIPGGTRRNLSTYGEKVSTRSKDEYALLADPQTSGGLLVSIDPSHQKEFEAFLHSRGIGGGPIGFLRTNDDDALVKVD